MMTIYKPGTIVLTRFSELPAVITEYQQASGTYSMQWLNYPGEFITSFVRPEALISITEYNIDNHINTVTNDQ